MCKVFDKVHVSMSICKYENMYVCYEYKQVVLFEQVCRLLAVGLQSTISGRHHLDKVTSWCVTISNQNGAAHLLLQVLLLKWFRARGSLTLNWQSTK